MRQLQDLYTFKCSTKHFSWFCFATYATIKINLDFALLTDSQETSLSMGHLHIIVKSSNSMHLCV